MTAPNHDADALGAIDVFKIIRTTARTVVRLTLAFTGLATILAGIYFFWGQAVRRTFVLEFRPTFQGADRGEYPNGIPFAASDVTASQITDSVFNANQLEDYCSREDFSGGFFVEQRSTESMLLDAEYQPRLAEERLTTVERQALVEEYEARRQALPARFRLIFVQSPACRSLSPVLVTKAMTDVLSTWATESEAQRGVLNLQVDVLSSATLDAGAGSASRLQRADLVRTAVERIIASVDAVAALPGSSLIRPPGGRTFPEIRNRLADIARAKLDPLVIASGQSMTRESLAWVNETLITTERAQKEAADRAAVYEDALRQYSGGTRTAAGGPADSGGQERRSSDVQTLSPVIDSTFIDRIVELSAANAAYRKELTQSMVDAKVESVRIGAMASYYRRLLASLRDSSPQRVMTVSELDASLDAIVEEAKALTQEFNQRYAEFTRLALRAPAAMFRIEKPVSRETLRAFTGRHYFMVVAGTFVTTLLLAFGYGVIRERLKG